MTDRELERKLATAVLHTAPDDLEGVLSRCETRKGNVIPMKKTNYGSVARKMIAACLALMLVGGGTLAAGYRQDRAVSSVVSLDVNPSIELQVNRKEKVLACKALNDDARAVLAEMGGGEDLEGAKLDVAVNAIVGALVRHGYLESVSSAILISVEDENQGRADRLRKELTAAVDQALQSRSAGAAVLTQTVTADEKLQQQAESCGISAGKAALVEQAAACNSKLAFDELAALSVEELRDLIGAGAPAMPIGKTAAEKAAVKYAGLWPVDGVTAEVDPELDDRPAHYEVELHTPFGRFEYTVDAYTGEILSGQKNVDQTKPETPAAKDVGDDQALSIALKDAGVKTSRTEDVKVDRDVENGRMEYEVEFTADGVEYEYTIGGDGTILKSEQEPADDVSDDADDSNDEDDRDIEDDDDDDHDDRFRNDDHDDDHDDDDDHDHDDDHD